MEAWGKIKPFLYLLLSFVAMAFATYLSYINDKLGCIILFGIPASILGFITIIYFFVMLIQIIFKYE